MGVRGMGSRPRLHGGQALCGNNGGGGMGMGPRIREDTEGGWVPALVFTGGRLCAGTTEAGAWGSRIRLHGGQALGGNNGGGGGVPASARTRKGARGSRIRLHGGELSVGTTEAGVGFPHPSSRGWEQRRRGWGSRIGGNNGGGGGVPASVFTSSWGHPSSGGSRWEQRRRGWGSRIRLHGGELSVEVHGRVHPHPNLPPAGGSERRGGVGSLRFYGGGHSAGTMGMGPRIREDNGWGRGREGRVGGWRCGRGGF